MHFISAIDTFLHPQIAPSLLILISMTSNETFPVQIIIEQLSPRMYSDYSCQNPDLGRTKVKVISLPAVKDISPFLREATTACESCLRGRGRNGQAYKGEIGRIYVTWQGAGHTCNGPWTQLHNGNVRAVLQRLRLRAACNDVVVLVCKEDN